MNRIFFLVLISILFWNCKENNPQRLPVKIESTTYQSYGTQFDLNEVSSSEEFSKKIVGLTDTIQITMRGFVAE